MNLMMVARGMMQFLAEGILYQANKNKPLKIYMTHCLGIETSCDETACSIVKGAKHVLSNVIYSQKSHIDFGGVVPEIASREHLQKILPTVQQALDEAGICLGDLQLIAATKGPGLQGALMIGLNTAKALSLSLGLPFIGVHHLEAHLYAAMMELSSLPSFPCMGLIVSGGHTSLVLIRQLGDYEQIGQTVDDALGEAFDKLSAMMDLGYPGGPLIEALASKGCKGTFPLKAGEVKGQPFSFSFSGLKTAALYALKGPKSNKYSPNKLPKHHYADLAACFQEAAFSDIVHKTYLACEKYGVSTIIFGGGVTQSQTLRKYFQEKLPSFFKLIWPSKNLCMDNGAMIAGLGSYLYHHKRQQDTLCLQAENRLSF